MTAPDTRRRLALGTMLGAPIALAASAAALPASALAAEAAEAAGTPAAKTAVPGARGPEVYMGLDQRELDDAYDQRVWAPNRDIVTQRMNNTCDDARARLGEPLRRAYGDKPVEGLDIFRTDRPNAPIQIYIHGGAWRSNTARDHAYPAETVVRAGAHFIAIDFDNVNGTDGSLFPMVDQVRRAIAWTWRNAKSFGGDPQRLYVSGRSSGSHLGACAAITDWKAFGLPADAVKGYVLQSGMYDLRGPRLSRRSSYVKFTDEMEHELSPQRHLARIGAPLVLLWGSNDSPEFQRQGRDFTAAVRTAGRPVQGIFAQGYNHYEIAESFANPYGPVGRAALEQMKLARA
ncbi:MAG: alpha/beta hydrolase [Betaproteobacteria bacterium]|jgi:arylformamidase|nr:alpha/beta hydrolase [Betaproteobacteria bacterium]